MIDVCPRFWRAVEVFAFGPKMAICKIVDGKAGPKQVCVTPRRRREIIPTVCGLSFSKKKKETKIGEVKIGTRLIVVCLDNGAVTHWATGQDYKSAHQVFMEKYSRGACLRDWAIACNLEKV